MDHTQPTLDPALIDKRPLKDEDMPFIDELYRSTRWEEMQQSGWPDEEIIRFLSFQCNAQHQHYMKHYHDADFDILLYEGKPMGRLYLLELKNEFRIVDIALLPAFRGGGLGRHLLDGINQRARAVGKMVRIHVEHNNPAMRLYKRLGFKKVDEVGVYHLMEWHP